MCDVDRHGNHGVLHTDRCMRGADRFTRRALVPHFER
jgi:hypothetical protein